MKRDECESINNADFFKKVKDSIDRAAADCLMTTANASSNPSIINAQTTATSDKPMNEVIADIHEAIGEAKEIQPISIVGFHNEVMHMLGKLNIEIDNSSSTILSGAVNIFTRDSLNGIYNLTRSLQERHGHRVFMLNGDGLYEVDWKTMEEMFQLPDPKICW